jgi:nicotinamide mononucleotide transporter
MNIFSYLALTVELGGIPISLGDGLGFVTGLACVWLTAKANIWNFPTGILNSFILGLVFLDQRLFADSALQLVFIALSINGWIQWSTQCTTQAPTFRPTNRQEQVRLLLAAAAMALLLWLLLVQLRGTAPPLDALITALSLCAQWQLNKRQTSSWFWWIAVDLISVPLYWSRGLPLIAALYVIFLVICLQGLWNWRRMEFGSLRESRVLA